MTRADAEEILMYVANNILSPMARDERKAKEVWEELVGEPFSTLCKKFLKKFKKPLDKTQTI